MAPSRAVDAFSGIPESFKAFRDNWIEITNLFHPYTITMEDDFFDHNMGNKLADTLINMSKTINHNLYQRGKTIDSSINVFEHLVGDVAFVQLVDYTTQALVSKGNDPTNVLEFQQFIATKILRGVFNLSNNKAFSNMEFMGTQHGFSLMSLNRYNQVMFCLSGYDIIGRTANEDDDFWFCQDRLLQKLRPLEKVLFENSAKLLLNKTNGCLVIDDELIASRANDTELAEQLRQTARVRFETKYVLRMFDALIINTWRCIQANLIKESLLDKNITKEVSAIRRQLYNYPLTDFALEFAVSYLRELRIRNSFGYRQRPIINTVGEIIVTATQADRDLLFQFDKYKKQYKWPKVRNIIESFSKTAVLNNLRLYNTDCVKHKMVRISKSDKNKKGRHQCRLCYRPATEGVVKRGRQTTIKCSLCEVPLCVKGLKLRGVELKSCWDRWHQSQDLHRENTRCQIILNSYREKSNDVDIDLEEEVEQQEQGQQHEVEEVGEDQDMGQEETEKNQNEIRRSTRIRQMTIEEEVKEEEEDDSSTEDEKPRYRTRKRTIVEL